MNKKILTVVILALFSVSCARMVNYYISNMHVSVEEIKIDTKPTIDSVKMDLELKIKNDNFFNVYITGFSYNVMVGKSIIASGRNPNNKSFMIKEKGIETLPLNLDINLKKAGVEFMKAYFAGTTDIKIYGKVDATSEFGNFSFDYSHSYNK